MFKDIKNLINSMTHQPIKLSIELLTGDNIYIPELTEEFESFSIQGNVVLDSMTAKNVKSIAVQFNGYLDSLKDSDSEHYKSSIVHNKLELLSKSLEISSGTSIFGFELALLRSLPPSVNSQFFKLKYTIIAVVEFEDSDKLTKNIPIKVYNNFLLPNREIRQNFYENNGIVRDLIYWGVEFNKRLFKFGEIVKFKAYLEPRKGVILSYISVKLLQSSVVFRNNNDIEVEEGPKSDNQVLGQENRYINHKQSAQAFEFSLPIAASRSINKQQILVPTMESSHFEITHRVQIQLDYILPGEFTSKVCNLFIPIAIASNSNDYTISELPNYEKIGTNSTSLSISELPPIYSN